MNYNDSVISSVKFVSLAYTLGKGLDEQFGKLFMYKNIRGPIIIPLGDNTVEEAGFGKWTTKRTYLRLFF